MKKNSIFSREYEKKIRRKRFAILSIVLIFFTVLVCYIVNFSRVNNYVKNVYYSLVTKEKHKFVDNKFNEEIEDNKNSVEENKQDNAVENKVNENTGSNNTYYEVLLEGDIKLKIPYTLDKNVVQYVNVDLNDNNQFANNFRFDVSPKKDKILIEDIINQNIYILDSTFNLKKIDPEFFYSNSAASRFYKKDVLTKYENYFWYSSPRFIDDNTLIYISNLPWFGKNQQYIWKTDLSDIENISHSMTSVSGENITFEELTEEGIKVNINNEIKLLTFSFVLN